MNIEPIGIFAVFIGLFCLLLGNSATTIALVVASVFGSAAALFVSSANIQPGHVLLGFLAIGIMTRRHDAQAVIRALHPGEPGFWLALLVVYGVSSAYFAPRLFAGGTQIIPLGTTIYDNTGSTVPLVPVSSNLTQSIYMVGNLLCFAMTAAVASRYRGFTAVITGLIGYALANTLFALLDIATFSSGTQDFLSFMRNAQYTLHTEDQIAGLKRIVGSFTEASSFARSSLGVLGFAGTLWLWGYRPRLTGMVAAASVVLLVISTSSTGLVGAPILLVILFATAVSLSGQMTTPRYNRAAIVATPLILLAVALIVAIDVNLFETVYTYVDIVVLGKSDSDSGIERHAWNIVALQNFFDSWGLGVGLGTARTSSFLLSLIANVGIPGTVFYAAFAYGALIKKEPGGDRFASNVRLAARNGCFGLLIGDLLVSPAIDQGLAFYVLAALASSHPEHGLRYVRALPPVGAVI